MARKRRKMARREKLNASSAVNYAKKGALLVLGMAGGAVIQKAINSKSSVSGSETDLLGLDGTMSKYVTPIILIVSGMAINSLSRNESVKMFGLGVGATGGVNLVNAALGSNMISLSGDNPTALMPGVGEIVNYDQLPTDNDMMVENPDGFTINGEDVDFAGTDDYSIVNGMEENIL